MKDILGIAYDFLRNALLLFFFVCAWIEISLISMSLIFLYPQEWSGCFLNFFNTIFEVQSFIRILSRNIKSKKTGDWCVFNVNIYTWGLARKTHKRARPMEGLQRKRKKKWPLKGREHNDVFCIGSDGRERSYSALL